jgi:hypothetical protein
MQGPCDPATFNAAVGPGTASAMEPSRSIIL